LPPGVGLAVGTADVQRSSAICAQTEDSVCELINFAACAQVVKAPIEQIIPSPHPHTSSEVPPLMRKPQCGKACESIATAGH
jgi:hypothetical protein